MSWLPSQRTNSPSLIRPARPSQPSSRPSSRASNPRSESLKTSPSHHDSSSPHSTTSSTEDEPLLLLLPDPPGLMATAGEMSETKSSLYLVLLTLALGGLQMTYSVEFSNVSPYLLSLGLSKSMMALVWLAGPLSGIVVQPYVGALSDRCQSRWGKRRPFIVGGTVATVVALMLLAWTRELVTGLLVPLGADESSDLVRRIVVLVAVVGVYVLDFAVNVIQAGTRAFIVDGAPAHQQEAANAMASRALGLGTVVGFIVGYANLQPVLWFLGGSQFKVLCVVTAFVLITTVGLSVTFTAEYDAQQRRLEATTASGAEDECTTRTMRPNRRRRGRRTSTGTSSETTGRKHRKIGRWLVSWAKAVTAVGRSIVSFVAQLARSTSRLPPQIKTVCKAEVFAYAGLFPFLFYTSSYIGELYVQPFLELEPNMPPSKVDRLYEDATRAGTYALLINSIVSLLVNFFLPIFVTPTYDAGRSSDLDWLRIPWLTLRRAWLISLVVFTFAMIGTLFVRSVAAATVLISLCGFTWAMTIWAPYSIISAEVSRRSATVRAQRLRDFSKISSSSGSGSGRGSSSNGSGSDASGAEEDELDGNEREPRDRSISGHSDGEDQAGVVMGIHNVAMAAPQVFATVESSIVFRIWQKPRGTPGDHSISITLALGGLAVLGAVYFVTQVRDDVPAIADLAATAAEEGVAGGSGVVSASTSAGAGARAGASGRSLSSLSRQKIS